MFARQLDDSYPEIVRRNLDRLVWARLVSNACYRYAPPFIALIASGLHVTVARVGVAMGIAELAGLASPIVGRRIDRSNRILAMTIGMIGIIGAVVLAACSINTVMLAAGLFLLSINKVVFDTALIVWINDHVAYERRGRLVGIIETSWALGLFIGVSAMGIVATIFNWRIGFLVGAIAMGIAGGLVVSALPRHEAHPPAHQVQGGRVPLRGFLIVATTFMLMGGSQCLTITFGPWFKDYFGFHSSGIVAIVVVLGFIELVASISSSRVSDLWGKERSASRGAMLMAIGGAAMAIGHGHVVIAVPMLVVFMLGFEFAVVSVLPVAANIAPGSSGTGLGMAVGAGTFGRAALSPIATSTYTHVGPAVPTIIAAAMALAASGLAATYGRTPRR